MSARGRLQWSLASTVVAAVLLAPPASATAPVVGSPLPGFELPLAWSGPVEAAWYEDGEMRLEVTGPGYDFVLGPIGVSAETRYDFQQYAIDPLPAVGTYTVTASHWDGTESHLDLVHGPPAERRCGRQPGRWPSCPRGLARPPAHTLEFGRPPAGVLVVGVDTTAGCLYLGAELTPGTVTSCTLYWEPELGEHMITVTEVGAETFVLSGFRVDPHLSIESASVFPDRFYPYARDGYRDGQCCGSP
jgi:hypothetical protein